MGFLLAMIAFQLPTFSARAAEEEANPVPNASFESVNGDRLRGWRPQRWGGEGRSRPAEIGRTGQRSALLESTEGADIGWSANVAVEPFSRYRLSGWIKTEGVTAANARGALINVHDLQSAATPAVTGTQDWTSVQVEFDTEDQDTLQVNCLLGGWGLASGKAWFDDIALVKVGQREVPAPQVSIRADQVGAPMSYNIYSQFIEHLGRCIYGGIWAEMLEDRKFYHPITEEYAPFTRLQESPFPVVGASPWERIGSGGPVRMDTEAPFVGRHTPVIPAGSGIRQNHLGLTAGKAYVGYVWLRAAKGERASARVALRWGAGPEEAQVKTLGRLRDRYRQAQFEFIAGGTTDAASLELTVDAGSAWVGAISLMPADHVEGMRADTLVLLRELQAPIYRWPGGNFVSGYDWRDGVGDRDRRPPRTNPAWTGVEHNDFGMHEFVRFCELVDAEPWITVNTGFGDAYSAAAQLEYCNGERDTHFGRQRAANGSPAPFDVRYWGIGNEMWGNWQLGYMQLEHYVLKQNWVVDKMREVDPDILCIASGNAGPWSTGLLRNCSDHMDFIAEHFYCQERPGLSSHVRQIPDNIRRKADFLRGAQRELPGLEAKGIRIAMTEWNYWYGPHVFGELGTRYFLKDGLGIAAGLHEFARQSDVIDSAFYAQTVNVIGCIKTSRRNAAFETTGLVLKLYRQHFGPHPVATEVKGLLDAQAAWTEDRQQLTLGVVNPTLRAVEVPFAVTGATLKGTGTCWEIAGEDPMAYNDPDEPPRVVIREKPVSGPSGILRLAPCSVTLFALDTQ
jgi:alpha-N-arabinofuranosidase